MQQSLIDISWSALFKVASFVLALYLFALLKDVLIMLFVVFIFVAAVNPTIVALQSKHISRGLAVTIFYAVLATILLLLGLLLVPTLIAQSQELVRALPAISGRLINLYAQHRFAWLGTALIELNAALKNLPGTAVQTAYGLVSSLAITITGIVLSVYLLLEEKSAKEFFHQILPSSRYQAVYLTVSKISMRMGMWVRSELLLMLIIGFSSLIVYLLFGVPSALALGLWTGLCEAIPVVGPLLGVLPALLVSFSVFGVLKALALLLVYTVCIQQFEAHIIVPRIMGKALGLSPVLVILALLIGSHLFGFIGVLVAVPTAAAISVVVGEWPSLRRIWEGEPDA